jgi:hypothetical protein
MSMKKCIAVLLAMAVLVSACVVPVIAITVRGSGSVITENRTLKGFDQIQLSTLGKLEIMQGEEEGLEISAEGNLLPYINTTINGKKLEIRTASNVTIEPTKELIYTLKVKNISEIINSNQGTIHASKLISEKLEIGISSSGDIDIGSLNATDLQVRISSIGNLNLAGAVTSQDVNISSRGNYNGGDLQSQTAVVRISSSGNAKIWVVIDLSVQISSSGNVDYFGSPRVISKTSSSGKVNALGGH